MGQLKNAEAWRPTASHLAHLRRVSDTAIAKVREQRQRGVPDPYRRPVCSPEKQEEMGRALARARESWRRYLAVDALLNGGGA